MSVLTAPLKALALEWERQSGNMIDLASSDAPGSAEAAVHAAAAEIYQQCARDLCAGSVPHPASQHPPGIKPGEDDEQ